MAGRWIIPFLVAMMLLTGVCNTLLSKYQDLQCVRNCDSDDPAEIQRFSQPVIQTAQMFIGEMGCWLVIAAAAIFRRIRFGSRTGRGAGGYTALSGHDSDDVGGGESGLGGRGVGGDDEQEGVGRRRRRAHEEEDDERDDGEEDTVPTHMGASISSLEPHNPVIKSLVDEQATSPASATDDKQRILLTGRRILLLAMPACCDIIGTTFMNAGLLFVAASIYQMTRGALVLFVGLFSVVFLKRRLALYQWTALIVVVLGVAVVGLAGAIEPNPQKQPDLGGDPTSSSSSSTHPLSLMLKRAAATAMSDDVLLTVAGVLMIALAQIFTATQFVLEEYIVQSYELGPLEMVGWEGLFGFVVTILAMIVLHFLIGQYPKGRGGYFDAREGWRQVVGNRVVAVTSVLIMISIGGFNFFGLSVTRSVSATARSTIDTCRTLFIWIVSLGLGWETFKWLQIVGFALLVYGTFLFNDIVRPPLKVCLRGAVVERRR